ncbi:bifunctional glutamate N-acetyltransferase/amino-acid acetyltransferase ArgJ [Candidatus Liberibacter asiaticus]|nr:bifunctional glutamate N-acetyltransferase/amino-acid acetyltransferase ArgJ [Candidatus Liberibacter asiaticus]ASK53242.1 bifunctional ornithine acetyltransferase/N-acetylglutamate synthase [Candidatus Liberibacter asiaticus]KIH96295.1 N-acetylglutamate synthase [Candidatus Liberibacter asiaticus]KPG63722.1 N-acetylglutamate synthase [Candidatus Liberibacter asiaticus]KRF68859.1 N-acetylglutamate synthase [Candidatus Liberibacter asiaticus]MBA2917090.1 bifunctional glutamate N-acetyltransf
MLQSHVSPVLLPIKGVRLSAAALGIKYVGRDDVFLMVFDNPASVAGVFTRSSCPSAPVDFCKGNLSHGIARALIVNSGIANAFTGKRGRDTVRFIAKAVSELIPCKEEEVYVASTGIIGEFLDVALFDGVLSKMLCDATDDAWLDSAKAMMTTDRYAKVAVRTVDIDGIRVTINGLAKGAGMIAPDMATTLAFVVTDINISPAVLQNILSEGAEYSFNSITVDGDTSTSDTLLLFATGTVLGNFAPITDVSDKRLSLFRPALFDLLKDLALQVVCDGEGASKLLEVTVKGAADCASAKKVALSIANSPLVKTAFASESFGWWGRIVMAVGKSGVLVDRDRLSVWFGDVRIANNGEPEINFSQESVRSIVKKKCVPITVDLQIGNGIHTVWTCDFSKEYIHFNSNVQS